MAIYTVSEIQNRIATVIDHSATGPDSSTSEYAWRLKFMNRAYQEWGGAYDWEGLRKETFLSINGVSQASISLPGDFKRMAIKPILFGSTSWEKGETWPEIKPEDRNNYVSTEKYFYLLGGRENQTMIWNPGTLASGASLLISYFSFPTSLVSSGDTVLMSDPEFVIERTIAFILETRSDPRYQQAESKAREKLLQMIDEENNRGYSLNDSVKNTEQVSGFRIGRD